MRTDPGPISRRAGTFEVSRPATPAVRKMAPVRASSRIPVPIAEKCRTFWKYRTMNVSTANAEAEIANAEPRPPMKVGLRSSPRSNIGRRCLSSTTMNSASRLTPVTIEPITLPEPHECEFDSIRPYTSPASPALKVRKPSQSGPVASGSRDSSTPLSVSRIATRPIGTLTKKIHRHDR
jgi:hypothetical protein